jgi:CDP-glucose 4,6-dehydratase
MTSTIADIRDLSAVTAALEQARPDVVFHLAAQSLVLRSYEEPVETFATNVVGTVNVLEAVRNLDARCAVVNVTSDKCYENRGWPWGYRETDELGGKDPYSSSKACADLVGRAYRTSYFSQDGSAPHAAVANARAGNVVGGGDWTPGQLVPDAVEAFAANQPVSLRHPEAIRPWQHVLDCLAGYLLLAERLYENPFHYSGDWNFGPERTDSWPVARIVDLLGEHWPTTTTARWIRDLDAHPSEEVQLRLDASKAMLLLGWQPMLPLGLALEWVADWYRGLAAGGDAASLCDTQLAAYHGLAAQASVSIPTPG